MKKLILLLLFCQLLIPAHAQLKNVAGAAKRIQAGHILPRLSVSRWARQTNLKLNRRINQIPKLVSRSTVNVPTKGHPHPFTFQVQRTDAVFTGTASAFAINLNGKTWGVTAGHVMRNTLPGPHMKIQTAPHSFKIVPIKKFFIGNSSGADIALFEIPKEATPYLTILEPAKQRANAGEKISIPGFTEGKPLFIANEKVLFSNSMRLFIQRTPLEDLTGFCGSPVLGKNNTVLAVYSGFMKKDLLYTHEWFIDLPLEVKLEMPNLHFAVPVENLQIMAKAAEANSLQQAGKMMKVFNHPVAQLHPDEFILSVEQFRDGEKIGRVHQNALVEPGKLEQFFELEENDVLRVIVRRTQTAQNPSAYAIYDVNVSTGKVTEISEKEARASSWGR